MLPSFIVSWLFRHTQTSSCANLQTNTSGGSRLTLQSGVFVFADSIEVPFIIANPHNGRTN